jgi:dipeptidyl aminopeptidase/acylaminoacyl peptidase
LLPRPSENATLAELRPEQQLVVYIGTESNGTFLWTGNGSDARFEQRIVLNSHLGEIADAKRTLIEYRGMDGDSLKAMLVLPLGYEPGKRYPLLVNVYAGLVTSDSNFHYLLSKHMVSSANLNLIPARGYAVLMPSMPLASWGEASDPYMDLPKGVMGAVDKAIDLGIAHPERLGLIGWSYGGYSTYSLVTLTHRFKAAVTLTGISDLVSMYGTFVAPIRYDEFAHEELFGPVFGETGQARMGAPPWSDLWRYLRNSPIHFVDRVQTPLMIIQGDMDYVPIQQGEEFFTALYRMGKKAKFVRYWGEGHVISSPANVEDMWQRVFQWFDEHLAGMSLDTTGAR